MILANDKSKYAGEVYKANIPNAEFVLGDISKIAAFPSSDLLVGCYPCQGFSVGGAREPDRKINYLYREFVRALRQIKPKAFIVENVSGMRRADTRHLFDDQFGLFSATGYKVKWEVLDARRFGVPQDRTRLFFVGIRDDLDAEYFFPKPTHRLIGELGDLPSCPTMRDAIGGMEEWPTGEYDDQPFHWYYLSRNRYRGWDETSRTIVANSRHVSLHPVSPPLCHIGKDAWEFAHDGPARRLSFRECARLQGFPKDMTFPDTGSIRLKYRAVGNAVPPPLFAAVANALPDIF